MSDVMNRKSRLSRGAGSRKKQRLSTVQMSAQAQIGDGKLPNKYWVSVSSDYYLQDPKEGSLEWASETKEFKVDGKTVKQFNSYEGAKSFANSIKLGQKFSGVEANTVSVEDRISGQVYERSIGGHVTEDVKFTKQKEAEEGVSSLRKKTSDDIRESDVVPLIMAYEGGEASDEDTLRLFAHLIKSGKAWHLQGSYGRAAADMIESGLISKTGKIDWKKVDELSERG